MIALVVGSAPCVWSHLSRFWLFEVPHTVLVMNDMGLYYPRSYQYWCSLHPDFFRARDNRERRYKHKFQTVALTSTGETDIHFETQFDGQTAPFCIRFARHLGAERIVLAGIPQDGSGYWFAPPWEQGGKGGHHKDHAWWRVFSGLDVRSMSGNTAKVFGAVTEEWLCPQ